MVFKNSRQLFVRDLPIGGGAPVVVQTMTNKPASETSATIEQIHALCEAGCEMVRVAVPDMEAASRLGKIIEKSPVPVVADIHFDWKLAMESLHQGADKLRLNPGNLQKKEHLADIVALAKSRKVPIRIGVNSGSLDKKLLKKYGSPTADALFESASNEIRAFEELGFEDIVVSVKTFSVPRLIETNKMLASGFDYPLHIGVTESGTLFSGSIRSSVGIGSLLNMGIGDTIRVSLTADPLNEVKAAWEILKSLELRKRGAVVVSCPGCGRTGIDIYSLAEKVNDALSTCSRQITVAVMGCVVNGPGEAREADLGCAGGRSEGVIFRKGIIVKKVREEDLFKALMDEVEDFLSK